MIPEFLKVVTLNRLVRYYCAGNARGETWWTVVFLMLATFQFWQAFAFTPEVGVYAIFQIVAGVWCCYMAARCTESAVEWRDIGRQW